jgi:hypothetical protein
MLNRVRAYLQPVEEEEPPYGDFVVVSGPFGHACVTREVACDIEQVLDRRWRPKWVVFHDRVGSRFRVRTDEIRMVVESTTDQRAGDRQLDRARRKEEKADRRPWEDDC